MAWAKDTTIYSAISSQMAITEHIRSFCIEKNLDEGIHD